MKGWLLATFDIKKIYGLLLTLLVDTSSIWNILTTKRKTQIKGFFDKRMIFLHKSKVDPLAKMHCFHSVTLFRMLCFKHWPMPSGGILEKSIIES